MNLSVARPCTPKRRIILGNKTKLHVVWATRNYTVHNAQPDGEELSTAGDVVLEAASNMRFSTESTASQSAPVRFTTNLLMFRLMRRRRAKHAFLANRRLLAYLSLERLYYGYLYGNGIWVEFVAGNLRRPIRKLKRGTQNWRPRGIHPRLGRRQRRDSWTDPMSMFMKYLKH